MVEACPERVGQRSCRGWPETSEPVSVSLYTFRKYGAPCPFLDRTPRSGLAFAWSGTRRRRRIEPRRAGRPRRRRASGSSVRTVRRIVKARPRGSEGLLELHLGISLQLAICEPGVPWIGEDPTRWQSISRHRLQVSGEKVLGIGELVPWAWFSRRVVRPHHCVPQHSHGYALVGDSCELFELARRLSLREDAM